MLCWSSFLDEHFGVCERAKVVNLRVVRAGDRYLDRVGPRRQQKRAKVVCLAALELESLLTDVDRRHPRFEHETNSPFSAIVCRSQLTPFLRSLACQIL